MTWTTKTACCATPSAKFADDRLRPHIRQWFEDGDLPARELAHEFGALGVLGMHLKGYGCQGARPSQYGLVCAEIEAVDSGLRSLVSVQGSLAMYAIYAYGSEEQKQRWLPEMAQGTAIGCFGLTEPDSGSDPGSMRTRARRDGDDWILTGTKMWITNGSIADVAVVWARTDEGVRGFLVERGLPGFSAHDVHHKISLRASITSELVHGRGAGAVLGDAARRAAVCADRLAASPRRASASSGASPAPPATPWPPRCDYACSRTQFGKPIAGFQLTQRKLAELAVQLQQAQLTARRLGELKDAGRAEPKHISFGKFHNVRAALEICREARSILGGSGITTEYPVLRHAVNLETVYTYEGTHEVHTLVLGQNLTGLDAFR